MVLEIKTIYKIRKGKYPEQNVEALRRKLAEEGVVLQETIIDGQPYYRWEGLTNKKQQYLSNLQIQAASPLATMSRRKFLKAAAVGGAVTVAAFLLKDPIISTFVKPVTEIVVEKKDHAGMDSFKPPEMYYISVSPSTLIYFEPSDRIPYKDKHIDMEEFSKLFMAGDKVGAIFDDKKEVRFLKGGVRKFLNELVYVKRHTISIITAEFTVKSKEYFDDMWEYRIKNTVELETDDLPAEFTWGEPQVRINGIDEFGFIEPTYYQDQHLSSGEANKMIMEDSKVKAECRVVSRTRGGYQLLMQELISVE